MPGGAPQRRVAVTVVAASILSLSLALAAATWLQRGSSDGAAAAEGGSAALGGTSSGQTSSTTTIPTTTTTAFPPPPDPAVDYAVALRMGDTGPAVEDLQRRLHLAGYWLPAVDGEFGSGTRHAVTAFQKVNGLQRDGVAGPATRAALNESERPSPRDVDSTGRSMEVDLTRQVTFVVESGEVVWVLDSSSGKASTPTPPGEFTIERQIDGLRVAELGELWRPKYFNGGIAFHGFPSVPPYAASHGCVRLPNAAINMLWETDLAPVGTPVHVYWADETA